MDIDQAFPSKYLKASDLQGTEPTLTIERIDIEEVGKDKDERPCLYFRGKEKGVVLNKTNANNIGNAYGRDTDNWIGKQVTLFTAWVDFQGQSVEAIRIRPTRDAQKTAQRQVTSPPNFEPGDPGFSDDDAIPFN